MNCLKWTVSCTLLPPYGKVLNTHLHAATTIKNGYSRFLENNAATMMAKATC